MVAVAQVAVANNKRQVETLAKHILKFQSVLGSLEKANIALNPASA